jgi:hypothetical protein
LTRIQATLATITAAATLLLLPTTAQAQEGYTFTLSGLVGLGGAISVERGDGISNTSYQLGFSLITQPKTHVGLRLGSIDLASSEGFGEKDYLANADLTYVTVAGEYRYSYDWYESGLYLGLGAYQLNGTSLLTGGNGDQTAAGVVLGLTGEFSMTRRLGILVEIAGHWTDLQEANSFVTAQVGVAFHY